MNIYLINICLRQIFSKLDVKLDLKQQYQIQFPILVCYVHFTIITIIGDTFIFRGSDLYPDRLYSGIHLQNETTISIIFNFLFPNLKTNIDCNLKYKLIIKCILVMHIFFERLIYIQSDNIQIYTFKSYMYEVRVDQFMKLKLYNCIYLLWN